MEQFPHLKLVTKKSGLAAFTGGGKPPEETKRNQDNRGAHSARLKGSLDNIRAGWYNDFNQRESNELAPLDRDTITAFFQINPNLLQPTFDLESFGIEIISEETDGFIIGASIDNFRTLEEKIAGFINKEHSTGKIADFWKIIDGNREEWRVRHILSEELYSKWSQIQDDEVYKLEVSVAFAMPLGAEPDISKKGGQKRFEAYRDKQQERDNALFERQEHFENYINLYGSITSSIINLEDSFGAEIEISGKGFKDLVMNYPFVFEVVENEEISLGSDESDSFDLSEIEVIQPPVGSTIVGIIDSGIMEGHRLLAPAVDRGNSISYLNGDSSVADLVQGGGHGTKVAGAVLYPNGVSSVSSPYTLPCFIRNLRVLDSNNKLLDNYPAELMQRIVDENQTCGLFNLSVTSIAPSRTKHMSSWAAIIDKLIHENDKLFIISAGNITYGNISYYLNNGEIYPNYLENQFCRISNPAQSSFGISVGSIDHIDFENIDWKAVAGNGKVSAYSRIGQGIWGHIKPDLVEYGGGVVVSKNGLNLVRPSSDTATELIQSTFHGGSSIGKSSVGTSYSAPKVAHIAAILKQIYPTEGVNLIRALLVQGARLPYELFLNPSFLGLRHFGYGQPSLERVVRNSDYRITFYDTNFIKASSANIYTLQIPESIRNQGDDFEILVEVTLAYTSKVRRTRQKLKSYLGTWLDWTSAKLDESFEVFSERTIKLEEGLSLETSDFEMGGVIPWKIRERSDWGDVEGVNRNKSSLQKDWVILRSFQLPEELSFAVRGHKGWDKNFEEIPYAFTVSLEILGSEISIYQEIEAENRIEVNVENEVRV